MKQLRTDPREIELAGARATEIEELSIQLAEINAAQDAMWQDSYLLGLVTDGGAVHVINDRAFSVERGSTFLLSPGDVHLFLPDPSHPCETVRMTCVRFPHDLVFSYSFSETLACNAPMTARASGEALDELIGICARAGKEGESPDFYADEVRNHRLIEMILLFLRVWKNTHTAHDVSELSATQSVRDLAYLRRAVTFIHYSFRDPEISAPRVAERLELSGNYFGVLFKRSMGSSFNAYVKKLQMRFTAHLLPYTDQTVTEIRKLAGYGNIPQFINDFHETFGEPPQQYRTARQGQIPMIEEE